jgi:hypothetical protein
LAFLGLAACSDTVVPDLPAPTQLTYELEPSGNPQEPLGLLLRWDPVQANDLEAYNVYSRVAASDVFDFRATTTSTTFHDAGNPDLEYYVTALFVDGVESAASNTIFVDERLRLDKPLNLTSVSLDGALHLSWSDNAFQQEPNGFKQYRVYSTSYSLDDDRCGETWQSEGTTVSPAFLVTALTNGVPRCHAVSAESIEGFESLWSDARADTPRPDARNVLLYPMTVDLNESGFRFFLDANGDGFAGPLELGVVAPGNRNDIDFVLTVDGAGDVWMNPVRAGVEIALYGSTPVEDLTSIDIAPLTGFAATPIQAVPGFGYVFQIDENDGFLRFGAIRMTHVSDEYVIFDWSYQTDPGNPELAPAGS